MFSMSFPASVLIERSAKLRPVGTAHELANQLGLARGTGLPLGTVSLGTVSLGVGGLEESRVLASGIWAFDRCLPEGGFSRGRVTELAVEGPSALVTSLALATCRTAQEEGALRGGDCPWCAFIDPAASLYAPGITQAGIKLERLLVIQPTPNVVERVALRLAESQSFAVIVIDLLGVPGGTAWLPRYGVWTKLVRRMALALEGTETCVLLVTDGAVRRSLPLPVAMRIELSRSGFREIWVRIAKERRGRISSRQRLDWTSSEEAELTESRHLRFNAVP